MFNWWFGTQTPNAAATLVLTPDESGRRYAGFGSGQSLTLTATEGETVQAVMDRFNTYRGPKEQINQLYTSSGAPLTFQTPLSGQITAIVKYAA